MPLHQPNCAASRSHLEGRETRVTHREVAMPHRFHPTRVDAGEKVRMGDKMRVECSLIDDLATRDVAHARAKSRLPHNPTARRRFPPERTSPNFSRPPPRNPVFPVRVQR